MKKNIFLNQKYLVKWTVNNSAFLVQSPFNANAGIWWAKSWYQPSKYPHYFATGIDFSVNYQEIVYGDNGIEAINLIPGDKLFAQFTYIKNTNSVQYLQMTRQTKQQLQTLAVKQQLIFHEQFINNNQDQKLIN